MTTDDLKKKFLLLQERNQKLREERIRLESEVKTLQEDYKKRLDELLNLTETSTYEAAIELCKTKRIELDKETDRLNKELDKYINQSGGDSYETD